jgi:hypothetical protein
MEMQRSSFRTTAVWILLLIVAYLVGYIPLRVQISRLKDSQAQLQHQLQLAALRGTLGMASYEVNRNNFGNAAQYAKEFFDGLQSSLPQTADATLLDRFKAILAQRDPIATGLNQADQGLKWKLAQLYAEFYSLTAKR